MLLKLGLTSQNAVIRGGSDVTTTGSETVAQAGKSLSASATGAQVDAKSLTHQNGDVGPSPSALPSGIVVAFQFPKVGVGLGVTSANGVAYIQVVTSAAQTTSHTFIGTPCSHYDLYWSVSGGVEAQLGPNLSLALPPKTLLDGEGHSTERGCLLR